MTDKKTTTSNGTPARSAPAAFRPQVVRRRGLRDRIAASPAAAVASIASLGPTVLGLLVLLAVLFGLYFFLLGRIAPASGGREVPLSTLTADINNGRVAAATLYDEDARVVALLKSGGTVYAAYPRSDAQTAEILGRLQ